MLSVLVWFVGMVMLVCMPTVLVGMGEAKPAIEPPFVAVPEGSGKRLLIAKDWSVTKDEVNDASIRKVLKDTLDFFVLQSRIQGYRAGDLVYAHRDARGHIGPLITECVEHVLGAVRDNRLQDKYAWFRLGIRTGGAGLDLRVMFTLACHITIECPLDDSGRYNFIVEWASVELAFVEGSYSVIDFDVVPGTLETVRTLF